MKETLAIFLDLLNEAVEADPQAMELLIGHRVECNNMLADHPTIQCMENTMPDGKKTYVGMLGVINGICEKITGQRVAAQYEKGSGALIGFCAYADTLPVKANEEKDRTS
jgi:hypothetical protein